MDATQGGWMIVAKEDILPEVKKGSLGF